MKSIILSVVILLSILVQINAQTGEKKDKIKELLALQHVDSLTYKIFYDYTKPVDFSIFLKDSAITKLFATTNIADTARDNLRSIFADSTLIAPYLNMMRENQIKYDMVKVKKEATRFINEDMVNVYDKYFSLEEINDYIAFSKTKSGQKYYTSLPVLEKE